MDALEHLLEVEHADWLLKGASVCDVVEELATGDHLLDDVGNVLLLSVRLVEHGFFLKVVVFDDMLVMKLCSGLNLLAEQLESTRVEVGVGEIEDLEGVIGAILSLANFDLGGEARAKGPSELIIVEI